jgi:hypothetical protein
MLVYGAIVVSWVILLSLYKMKKIKLPLITVAVLYLFAVAFGLTYEFTLGEVLSLYHYYDPESSAYWILLMGVFAYPIYHVLYANWLEAPIRFTRWLLYTSLWVLLMLASEYWSIANKVVVLTGWRIWPWSIVTYGTIFVCDTLLFLWIGSKVKRVGRI